MAKESLDTVQLTLVTEVEALFLYHIDELAVIQDYSNLELPTVLVLGGEWYGNQPNFHEPLSIWRELASFKTGDRSPAEFTNIMFGKMVYKLTPYGSSDCERQRPITTDALQGLGSLVISPDIAWSRDRSEALALNLRSRYKIDS